MPRLDDAPPLTFRPIHEPTDLEAMAFPVVALVSGAGGVSAASVIAGRLYELPVQWTPRRRMLRLDARTAAVVVHLADDPDHRSMLRHGEALAIRGDDRLVFLAHAGANTLAGLGGVLDQRLMMMGEIVARPDRADCSVAEALRCPGSPLGRAWPDGTRAQLCTRCATLVHRVTTEEELVHHMAMGHCVAVPQLLATLVRVVRSDEGTVLLHRLERDDRLPPYDA